MGKVLTVLSTKGGVGKSTLTRFLSISLNEMGFTTCVLDLCQNSSVSTGFLKDRNSFDKTAFDWLTGNASPSDVIHKYGESNIYYIPANETIDDFEAWAEKEYSALKRINAIKNKVQPLTQMFDFIIMDTHPSENSDLVSYAIAASDLCLIPMEVDLDSKLAAERSAEIVAEFMQDYTVDYAIVPNKVSGRNGKIISQLEEMIKEMKEKNISDSKFLTNVRFSDLVSTSKNEGIMLNELENKYAQNTMEDFRIVTTEVLKRLKVELKQNEVNGNE
jgi:cellulose biosynthesis protein BcsQ